MIFLLVLAFLSSDINAQNNRNFNQFFDDGKEFVKAPTKWQSKEVLTFSSIIGGTFVLMNFDESIRQTALENGEYKNSMPAEFGRIWGEPLFTAATALLFSLHGSIFENQLHKQIAFEIIESGFYSSFVTGTLKYSFGRARPLTGLDAFTYKPFSFKGNEYVSFSSGHTALAFSLSTVISLNSKNDFLKAAIYLPAILTAASRVYQNHHWTSDVFFGACIGYFTGKFLYNLHIQESKFEKLVPPKPSISFSFPIN